MSRGMKQFMPFRSLPEQEHELAQLFYEYQQQEKPILSPDQIEEINLFLQNYRGETIFLTYFEDGYIYRKETKIKSINPLEQKLVLPKMTIAFSAILKVEKI
ncbi:MAG: YolD-like family protein [Bacilli bacterium]|jgi:hypothetical protein